MKQLFAIAILFIGSASIAQTESGEKIERMKVYKWENNRTTTNETKEKKEMTKEEEIAYCEGIIKSLDEKEKAIRSNPEELAKATQEGWFVEAEKTRAEMNARIEELKK
ncbi:MAG: hypothetical protein MK078_08965 [Crocinitomicaceae bacterium]|nr:hypothetical protein [Crocinitomicaceae bacterium]